MVRLAAGSGGSRPSWACAGAGDRLRGAGDSGSADELRHEVIVALPDDSLRFVCERVHAVGGSAAVAVWLVPDDNQFRLVTMDVTQPGTRPRQPSDDDLGTISGQSSVSLALEYMDQARLKTMSFHFKSPDCTLDVVDSGDVTPVCA